MGEWSAAIARQGRISLGLADLMLKGIQPATFAGKPTIAGTTIDTNHPAFVFGHLSLYPNGGLAMLRLDPGKAPKPAGFDDLVAAGKECRDDPAGTIYPGMETIVGAFRSNAAALLDALPAVDDGLLREPNPREGRLREMCPTIGEAISFLTSAHVMMHLGQVSAWRRCFGLGSAMG
ncbi:MAG: DinB family protein [Phycisphaerae bacterium]|nr:DinB family protein [Phycisphaerae bacterium]